MATIWLTYAWDDNKEGDVDFTESELRKTGLDVKRDKWSLRAGIPLWDQIAEHITNPKLSDAWVLYPTANSLASESCKEEFRYALNRAVTERGTGFPVIALFPHHIDRDLIPPAIQVRLNVSQDIPGWEERIKAAAEGRLPSIEHLELRPYDIFVHDVGSIVPERYSIEVRPRGGTWVPFLAGVPLSEKEIVKPRIAHGPKRNPPINVLLFNFEQGETPDRKWWIMCAGNEASFTQSYFVFAKDYPPSYFLGCGVVLLNSSFRFQNSPSGDHALAKDLYEEHGAKFHEKTWAKSQADSRLTSLTRQY